MLSITHTHIHVFYMRGWFTCVHMRVMSGVLCVLVKYVRVRYVYKIGILVYHLPNTRQPCQASLKNTQSGLLFVVGCTNVRRSLSLARSLSFERTLSLSFRSFFVFSHFIFECCFSF